MQSDFNEERLLKQYLNFARSRFMFDGMSDDYFSSFLKASRFDIQSALEMLEAHLNWRSEINPHGLMSLIPELDSFISHAIHKTDKHDRPIYIISFKPVTALEVLARFTESYLIEIFTGLLEHLRSRKPSDTQLTVLIDLANLQLPDELDKPLQTTFSKLVRTFQANYPEMLNKIYIINAVMHFSHLWNLLKMPIADRTKSKIVILGSRFESKLYEAIDSKSLPEAYGGVCECENGCLSIGLNGFTSKPNKIANSKTKSDSASKSVDRNNLDGLRSILQSLGGNSTNSKEPIIIGRADADTPMNTQNIDEDY